MRIFKIDTELGSKAAYLISIAIYFGGALRGSPHYLDATTNQHLSVRGLGCLLSCLHL